MDTGNTISKMKGDIEQSAEQLEWYTGLAIEMKGETIPASAKNLHITVREPFGVTARIVPFNHPLSFAARGLAGPLIAGNTAIIKPPETSSLSATLLGEICKEVLPPGVANIVSGNGMPAGEAIVKHPKIKRIAFTGSVPTGMAIQRAAAEGGIKALTLELGGKNPFIVWPDADPDKVADAAIAGMNFAWAGQSCGSTSRLMLHEDLYKKVLDRVTERVAEIKLGDPMDPKSQMGPVNSKRHMDRVNAMIKSGIDDGAKLMIGGKRPPGKQFERGWWVEPTVFGDVHRADEDRARGDFRAGDFGVLLARRGRHHRACQLARIRPHRGGVDQRHQARDQGRAPGAVRLRLDQWRRQLLQGHALRRLEELRHRQGKLPRGTAELHRGKIDPDHPLAGVLVRPSRGRIAVGRTALGGREILCGAKRPAVVETPSAE